MNHLARQIILLIRKALLGKKIKKMQHLIWPFGNCDYFWHTL